MKPVRVSQTGVGESDWIVLDANSGSDISLQVEPNGGTVTVQATLDPDVTRSRSETAAARIVNVVDMVGLTADGIFTVKGPVQAVRIKQTVGAGVCYLTAMADTHR